MTKTSVNGTQYELLGPDDAPVITLIHGLGLTHQTWAGHIDALTEHYRVLNYDLCGHGESAAPTAISSLSVFSLQLKLLLDELCIEKTALVGFSLGGMINRRFAIDFPQRVSALGIFNSPHERGEEAQRMIEERARQSDTGGPGANLNVTIKRWFTPDFIQQQPDFIDRVKGWVLANNPASYAQSRMVLAAGVTELIRPDPPLSLPALVITCENDSGSTPDMSQAIADEIYGGEVIIIPRLQHMGLTQEAEKFTTPLIEFLRNSL